MIPILRYTNIIRNLKNCYEIFPELLTSIKGGYFTVIVWLYNHMLNLVY